jgi:hypothetical protein
VGAGVRLHVRLELRQAQAQFAQVGALVDGVGQRCSVTAGKQRLSLVLVERCGLLQRLCSSF